MPLVNGVELNPPRMRGMAMTNRETAAQAARLLGFYRDRTVLLQQYDCG